MGGELLRAAAVSGGATTDGFILDIRYHDTSEHEFGDLYGSRAVATLKASF
jgi:hypothetical protein